MKLLVAQRDEGVDLCRTKSKLCISRVSAIAPPTPITTPMIVNFMPRPTISSSSGV